VFTDELKTIQV